MIDCRFVRPGMRSTGTRFCGRTHGAGARPLLRSTHALAERTDLADASRVADARQPLGPFRPRRAVGRSAVHSAAHRRRPSSVVTAGRQGAWLGGVTAAVSRRHCGAALGALSPPALCSPPLIAAALPPSSRPVGKVRGWEVSRQHSTFGIAVNPPPATRRFLALNGVVAALVTVPVLNFLAGFVTVFVGAVVQGLSLGGSITIGFDSWRIAQPTLFVGLLYAAANLIGAIAQIGRAH